MFSNASCSRRTAWRSASVTSTASTTDRKSTRLNSSHITISYAVFCLKKKNHHTATACDRVKARELAPPSKHKKGLVAAAYISVTKLEWLLREGQGTRASSTTHAYNPI